MPVLTTPLNKLHHELGARLVTFAGWEMPLQFEGVITEHNWCRSNASLFDVSHMGVISLNSAEASSKLERLTPASITDLGENQMRYGLLTNSNGGIGDDFMVSRLDNRLMLVVNASRVDKDLAQLQTVFSADEITVQQNVGLLAIQGPKAAEALSRIVPRVAELSFLQTASFAYKDAELTISRSGYSGEDGFEIITPGETAEDLARNLFSQPEVQPAGLGARDTLRLEAGLCLYGNDLDTTTTPVEAGLVWSIPKRRRNANDYEGAETIRAQIEQGPARKRVGIKAVGKRPIRADTPLFSNNGEQIGSVTSGGYGPSVGGPVAMGYVTPKAGEIGTQLTAQAKSGEHPCHVVDLPFVPHQYFRGNR